MAEAGSSKLEGTSDAVLIYSTFPNADAAATVAEAIVEQGLVACANILPGVVSLYIWQGRLEREQEVVMVMKTRAHLARQVTEAVRARHSYDNPAIVVLPIIGGSADFLTWIGTQTAAGAR